MVVRPASPWLYTSRSFATSPRTYHEQLLWRTADRVVQFVNYLTPRELSIVLWSIATLGFQHDTLMRLGEARAVTLSADGAAPWCDEDAINILWALSKLGVHNPTTVEAVCGMLCAGEGRVVHLSSIGEASVLAWALATQGVIHEGAVRRILHTGGRIRLPTVSPATLSMSGPVVVAASAVDAVNLACISPPCPCPKEKGGWLWHWPRCSAGHWMTTGVWRPWCGTPWPTYHPRGL